MAAKFVDAIAHMPGMDGEDSDATGAYTQTTFGPECPITWITLPKERWPKAWHNIYTDPKNPPVVILSTNLYGHPLAGLYLEKLLRRESAQMWILQGQRMGVPIHAQRERSYIVGLRR